MINRYYPGQADMDEELIRKSARVWQRVNAPEDTEHMQMTPEADAEMNNRTAREKGQPMAARTGCMDGVSDQSVQAVKGFILVEMEDSRFYSRFARCAPNQWASRKLMEIASEKTKHAKKLIATYYLMTGMNYCPHFQTGCSPLPDYCDGLRMRFAEECRGAKAYLEMTEETDDMCLQEMLGNLAEDGYTYAKTLRELLAREMKC